MGIKLYVDMGDTGYLSFSDDTKSASANLLEILDTFFPVESNEDTIDGPDLFDSFPDYSDQPYDTKDFQVGDIVTVDTTYSDPKWHGITGVVRRIRLFIEVELPDQPNLPETLGADGFFNPDELFLRYRPSLMGHNGGPPLVD